MRTTTQRKRNKMTSDIKKIKESLLGSLRRIDIGDKVEIVRILASPQFDYDMLPADKKIKILEGRNSILEDKTIQPESASQKIKIRGKITGRLGKKTWKIKVILSSESTSEGVFLRKEFIRLS